MSILQQQTVSLLVENNLRIALAESCTGGLIASALTDVSGASQIFECGVICYSNRIKHEVLGVDDDLLQQFGAVSEQTAYALCHGVKKLGSADIGLGITGFAGPGVDEPGKEVGLIFIGITDGERTEIKKIETHDSASGCRARNRHYAVQQAFELISDFIRSSL